MGWKDKARERVKEKQQGNRHQLTEGTNCMRVLPNKKDLLPDGKLRPEGIQHAPCVEFRIHWNVGPDKAMLGCGKDVEGRGKCWLCDKKIPELEASDSKSRRVQAADLKAQDQFLTIATRYDADTKKFSSPKPWPISGGGGAQSLAVRVYSKIASSKKDYVDPVKGYNLNIERQGTGLKTRYPEVEGDETPSKVPLSVLAAVKPLEDFIPKYSEEAQKSAYFGRPQDDDDDEDGGSSRGSKKRRRDADEEEERPRRRKRDEDDEPEEDGEESEGEEDEEYGDEEPEEEEEGSDDGEEDGEESEEGEEDGEESEDDEPEEEEEEPEDGEEDGEEAEEEEEEPEEEEEEPEEEPEPAPKKKLAKKGGKPAPAPAGKSSKKPAAKKSAPPPKKGKKR